MPFQIVTRLQVTAEVTEAGPHPDFRDHYTWWCDPASTIKPADVWRVDQGHFVIRFPDLDQHGNQLDTLWPTDISAFVMTDGISPGAAQAHSDVLPIVRNPTVVDGTPEGELGYWLEIELIRYAGPGASQTGYRNANSNFWLIIVQGEGSGDRNEVNEGWPYKKPLPNASSRVGRRRRRGPPQPI